jgi:hypothetical protein
MDSFLACDSPSQTIIALFNMTRARKFFCANSISVPGEKLVQAMITAHFGLNALS